MHGSIFIGDRGTLLHDPESLLKNMLAFVALRVRESCRFPAFSPTPAFAPVGRERVIQPSRVALLVPER